VQELNDDVLRQNGRVHLCQDVERAFGEIRNEDFDILNVDMISGLIGQTDASFMASLDRLIDLNPDTITFYQLEIPHNTPLFRSIQTNGPDTTPWETKRRRIESAFERLESVGYEVVSGYAAARGPNPYRMMYMEKQYRGADLLGIGASAFSYIRGCHFQNLGSLEAYLKAMAVEGLPIDRSYVLDDHERMIREFVLQLKLGGVDLEAFRRKFCRDVSSFFAEPLARMAKNGWLEIGEDRIDLTRRGLLRVDRLIHEFF
jgi:oxygen-independent coproporphyrinogen-3 oxidase